MKRNGFSESLHCLQILSYVAVLIMTLGFYSLIVPAFNLEVEIPIVILYSLALASTLYHGYKCTACDPTDPSVYTQLKPTPEYTKICKICRSYVHTSSKHCRECDRCVNGFDHHCMWMNNCVGDANYRFFFRLIISFEIMVCMELCLGLYVVYGMFDKNEVYYRVMRKASKVSVEMSSHQIVPKDINDSIEELYEPYILRGDETTFRIEEIRPRYPNFIKKAGVVQSEPTKSSNSRDLSSENFQKNDSRHVYSAIHAEEEDSAPIEEGSSNISV